MKLIDLNPAINRTTIKIAINQDVKYQIHVMVKINLWNSIIDLIFVNISNEIKTNMKTLLVENEISQLLW